MPFDILSNSALEIANGIYNQAYGGKAPDGLTDFPSGCVFSKCTQDDSDVHVDFGLVEDNASLSEIKWLADVTGTDEQGPSDTSAPFNHPTGLFDTPGVLGTAIKAYGEVVALSKEYGIDYTEYDIWFRDQWGIPDEADLEIAVPKLRSHGNALWGGMKANLAPAAEANIATSKQMKVNWHNVNRKTGNRNKLVDWPRLNAILKIVGSSLMVEDSQNVNKIKRIDFKLVWKEIPDAPKRVKVSFKGLAGNIKREERDTYKAALEYIRGHRKDALVLASKGGGLAVEFEDDINISHQAVAHALETVKTVSVPFPLFMEATDEDVDLTLPVKNENHMITIDKKVNVPEAFSALIYPYVANVYEALPLPNEIRNLLDDFEEDDDKIVKESYAKAREIIKKVCKNDLLVRFYRYFLIAKKDRHIAWKLVVNLLQMLKVPKSMFSNPDLLESWNIITNHKPAYPFILNRIADTSNRHTYIKGQTIETVGILRRLMASEGTLDYALSEIIKRRRNYWANEYHRRSKSNKEKRVVYQIKSKLFRVTTFLVKSNGLVIRANTDSAQKEVLFHSAGKFVAKRTGKYHDYIDPPEPGYESLGVYAGILDTFIGVGDHIYYSEVISDYERSVAMLTDDLSTLIDSVIDFSKTPYCYGGLDEDIVEDKGLSDPVIEYVEVQEDGEEFAISDEDIEETIQEIPKVVPANNDDGWDDDDDDDFGVASSSVKQVAVVDLLSELADDYPMIPVNLRLRAVRTYGAEVSLDRYKEISNSLYKDHLTDLANRVQTMQVEGSDLLEHTQ